MGISFEWGRMRDWADFDFVQTQERYSLISAHNACL